MQNHKTIIYSGLHCSVLVLFAHSQAFPASSSDCRRRS